MPGRFGGLFGSAERRILPLTFVVDLDEAGRHVVSVYKLVGGQRYPVEDVSRLLKYGYYEMIDEEDVLYTVSDEDRLTLMALSSLHPERRTDGKLVCTPNPPMLKFLRRNGNMVDAPGVKTMPVLNQSLPPTILMDFDPEQGLKLKAGYVLEKGGPVVPQSQLPRSPDGRYVRVGDSYRPLPADLPDLLQKLLARGSQDIPLTEVPEFVARDMVLIRGQFNAVLTDRAKVVRVLPSTHMRPVVRVDIARGWLDFRVDFEVDDYSIPESWLASHPKATYYQTAPGVWVQVDRKQVARVRQALSKLDYVPAEGGFRVPVTEFASLDDFIKSIGGRAELSAAYQEFLEQLTGFKANPAFVLSGQVEKHLTDRGITLRPYQRAGVHWLNWLSRNHLHGMLADDMGLGKTMQAILAMQLAYQQEHSTAHSLVVAPLSVLIHWERELGRCMPGFHIWRHHGTGRLVKHFKQTTPTVFVTTYDTVARDLDDLIRVPFFYLIVDEATMIKNPASQRTQAIKSLNAVHRLALSGTPVENRPEELWSLYDFLMRGYLGRHGTFKRKFEDEIMQGREQTAYRLGWRIRPFILRRKKGDVARDLPEKIEFDEWCDLTAEQRQLYAGFQDTTEHIRRQLMAGEDVSYPEHIFPIISKLKQLCDHPAIVTHRTRPLAGRSEKFDWVTAKIDEIVAGREQVVVFSHFLEMLNLLEAHVTEAGLSYVRIDGTTTNRQVLIDRFNAGGAKVALCSLKAAGHGINLTAANHVIHADRWWNPAVEDQATDRVHRIGQDRTVYVYRILVAGTLEERIDRLLAGKRDLSDLIMRAATTGERAWTREELIELLRPLD